MPEHSNDTNFGFDFNLCSGLLLRLWRAGVAVSQAIGAISSLRALYTELTGSRPKPASIMIGREAFSFVRGLALSPRGPLQRG
jgi:hypothetical protein